MLLLQEGPGGAKPSPAGGRGASAPPPTFTGILLSGGSRPGQQHSPSPPRCAWPAGGGRPAAGPGGEEAAWVALPLPPSLQLVLGSLARCGEQQPRTLAPPGNSPRPAEPQRATLPKPAPSARSLLWPNGDPAQQARPGHRSFVCANVRVLSCTSPGSTALCPLLFL